jgi:membrane associated rhomboid family serine protease
MGIYDRDYERERDHYDDSPGFHLGGSLSWTNRLLIVMAIVYLVQLFTKPGGGGPGNSGWLTETFSLHANMPLRPWYFFELVTYGFLHDVNDLKHILFNGFALWMFGGTVEQRYGAKEYVTFFLTSIVFAGVVWIASEFVARGQFVPTSMLGASGGIAAVLILFCLNFPHQQLYIWGLFPLPAWVFAVLFVGYDLLSSFNSQQGNVAYTAHLGGAAFALAYYFMGMRLSRWLPGSFKLPKLGRRPPLRVHAPSDDNDAQDATDAAVDDILRKIREHGQESLTRQERKVLEQASREYQRRRK